MSQDPPSLYEWAGERPAFERLINAFYDRVEGDALLSPLFPGGVGEEHRVHVIDWWSEVFGGPATYTAEHGGYEHMLAKHRDLGITAEQRFRFASLMSLAADDAALPDDPEFRAALVGYLEWGTRLALSNSRPGADVVEAAPVPRWGWGVAPPYTPGSGGGGTTSDPV
jgi:hemoglobin